MFCPNCGTENPEGATTCTKCGFNLKGAAAPRFKGTMLMMNQPPAAPRPGGAPASAPKPNLKGTMLGVAPPASGGQAPPPQAPAPTPAPQAVQPAAYQPPAPQGAPNLGAPPGGAGGVNPLGGTMVAAPQDMNRGAPPQWGAPPQQAAPPAGGWGGPAPTAPGDVAPGTGPGAFGAPPAYGAPAQGAPPGGAPPAYGAPPGANYGAPPAGGAYGQAPGAAPAGGYGPPPGGGPGYAAPQGGAPGYAAGPQQQPGGIAPYGQPGMPQQGGFGARGAVGKERNPILVVVLGYVTCGIYFAIAMWKMINELKAFRGKDDLSPIMFFIPILGFIELLKLGEKVLEAKQMAGIPNATVHSPVLYLLFWPYFLTADLNEIWQAAGGARQLPAH